MKPVLSIDQIRAADAWTIEKEPVSSIDLMERAAGRCTEWLLLSPELRGARFLVLCGPGNNGGDGLAIARQLREAGREARVVVLDTGSAPSEDHMANRKRVEEDVSPIRAVEELPELLQGEVVIDAMLGSGLSRPLSGLMGEVVSAVNAWNASIVSIDLPSGLLGDVPTVVGTPVIRATWTLTFGTPKRAFFHRESAVFVGEWTVLPIGLDQRFIGSLDARQFLLEGSDVSVLLPRRDRFAHKGDFGHGLLIAGSLGKMGAAVLAARACLRSGAGLCTVHLPSAGLQIMQISAPEAMCSVDEAPDHVSALPKLDGFQAIGAGPGIGQDRRTAVVLKLLIQEARVPLVLDADALNILAENKTWLSFLPRGTVLTPHPKEFDRLAGPSRDGWERLDRAMEMAVKWGVIIVLKGAFTAVCDMSGRVFFNPTGNAGMARGGSGDALTGMITGLLAQGRSALQASLLGVYLHGLAGDIAAKELGMDAMTAGDLIRRLPAAFRALRRSV